MTDTFVRVRRCFTKSIIYYTTNQFGM